MAIKDQIMKIGIAGAIAGVATQYLLRYIVSPVLNFAGQYIPSVTAKLANPVIDINVQQSLTGIETGLGPKAVTWLTNALGVTVPSSIATQLLMAALGGALLFIAGALVADALGFLTGSSKMKTGITIFAGSLGAALLLGTMATPVAVGINLVNVLIAFGINAAILTWLFALVEDNFAKLGLMPF